jgi:glycosyltransferase involved in cell wall biosynthesis
MTATKMNICMVVSASFPPQEGMGYYVWNLSRILVKHGHCVQIITRGKRDQPFREEVEGITLWRPFFVPLYPFHVHLHSLFVSRLVRRLDPELDLFHSHSPLVPPLRTSKPVLLTFHSTVREDIKSTRLDSGEALLMKLQAPFSVRLEVKCLLAASQVSAVSPAVGKALHHYPGSPRDIPIIWNGVDTAFFKPPARNRPPGGPLLAVGRLGPGKGMEDLVEATALISKRTDSIKVVIIGDGPLKPFLERRVEEMGLTNVIQFEGYVTDREQLRTFYQQASLFVLPSHHEGLPTVVLEAMACGCPVLATRVGGVPSLIEEGVSGRLVSPGAPQDLATAAAKLLANPDQLAFLGLSARKTIEQGYSWEQIGSRIKELYSGLLMTRENHLET